VRSKTFLTCISLSLSTLFPMKSMSGRLYQRSIYLGLLAIFFIGCTVETTQNNEDLNTLQEMQAALDKGLSKIEPELRDNTSFVDLEKGFEYSYKDGLRRIDVGKEDDQGVIRFKDGTFLKKNSKLSEPQNALRPQALYSYLRSVNSIVNHNGVSADVTPPSTSSPSFYGIDQAGEAGYNYLGIRSTQTVCEPNIYKPTCPPNTIPKAFDVEGGIFTSAGPNWVQKKFQFYTSNNGTYFYPRWPTYDGYSGSTVQLNLRVIQDGQVQFTVYPVQEAVTQTWILNVPGAKASGIGAQVRKNTSLLANDFAVRFWGSFWQFGRVYKNSNASQEVMSSSKVSSTTGSCAYSCFPYDMEGIKLP
jgi:hypothetical protein